MARLTFNGNCRGVNAVYTAKERIFQLAFNCSRKLEVQPGELVRLDHRMSWTWYSDGGYLGEQGESCYFKVPKDAEGEAELFIDYGVLFDKYRFDKLCLNESKGWARNIKPFMAGEKREMI